MTDNPTPEQLDPAGGDSWRPIETAPREVAILLFGEPFGGSDPVEQSPVQVGALKEVVDEHWEYIAEDTQKRRREARTECSAWLVPTHWMPLPAPPRHL